MRWPLSHRLPTRRCADLDPSRRSPFPGLRHRYHGGAYRAPKLVHEWLGLANQRLTRHRMTAGVQTESMPAEATAHDSRDSSAATLTRDDLVAMYYYMQLTRFLEDRVRNLYLQGKLVGAVYRSMGQEGTAVASAYALEDGDYIAPLIRDLGASVVRGVPLEKIFAQWLGRVTGPSGGRDGNLHFGYTEKGVLAPVSMLGATIPVCAGVALTGKRQGKNYVAVAYIGDGGTNTGDFHEGLNFAATLRLPMVLVVENNGYAYSTPTNKQFMIEDLAARAAGYGI